MSSETGLFGCLARPHVCSSRFLILFSRTAGLCFGSRTEEDIPSVRSSCDSSRTPWRHRR